MSTEKTAVLLMNVGSPDEPKIGPVWKYLTEFLNDKRVIDLPWLLRIFLVNFIIIPFRVRNSTRLYKLLWTDKGSPLIYYSFEMKEKLQEKAGWQLRSFCGHALSETRIQKVIGQIKEKGLKSWSCFPLYPHHAMSTTETTVVAVKKELKRQKAARSKGGGSVLRPSAVYSGISRTGAEIPAEKYDHVVFSYHGFPTGNWREPPGHQTGTVRLPECHAGTRAPLLPCHLLCHYPSAGQRACLKPAITPSGFSRALTKTGWSLLPTKCFWKNGKKEKTHSGFCSGLCNRLPRNHH
jgi:protoheme ferro-lyase